MQNFNTFWDGVIQTFDEQLVKAPRNGLLLVLRNAASCTAEAGISDDERMRRLEVFRRNACTVSWALTRQGVAPRFQGLAGCKWLGLKSMSDGLGKYGGRIQEIIKADSALYDAVWLRMRFREAIALPDTLALAAYSPEQILALGIEPWQTIGLLRVTEVVEKSINQAGGAISKSTSTTDDRVRIVRWVEHVGRRLSLDAQPDPFLKYHAIYHYVTGF